MSDPGPTVFNGRYELHRRLGRGGMAEVFLARDQLLDRPVAVKVLFPEFATDPAFVERFRREATAAANLNHPNIVGVYDWGEADGTYFIVMEYVDGRTLSEILRAEGPLHPDRVADVGADVAAALGFAHRNGVVHRDVKPGNVLVTAAGQVKVADFGIARAITANADENLTQVGTVMGTATYFSPEQARGDAVDPRSDIYSLGCVLYELLVGRPPFSGDTPVAIAYKHVQESPVPPRQLNAELPPAIEAIVLKCLAKNPANRYPSAEDLRADLRRFREGSGILAEPVMAPPVDPGATSVVAATAAVAAADGDAAATTTRTTTSRSGRRGCSSSGSSCCSVLLAGMLFLLAQQFTGDDDRRRPGRGAQRRSASRWTRPQRHPRDDGFDVEITQEANEDQEEGIVFDQDPDAARRSTRAPPCSSRSAPAPRPSRCPTSSAPRSSRRASCSPRTGLHREGGAGRRRGGPRRRGRRPGPRPQRGGAPRLRGHALRVEGPGRPTGARRRRQDDRRGLQPARPGRLHREPDLRAVRHRRGGPRHPHRPARRHRAAEGRGGHRRRVERPGGERRAVASSASSEANAINTLDGAGLPAVVEEVATDDPTQDGRVVDSGPGWRTPRPTNGSHGDDRRRAVRRARPAADGGD